ncbi:MAG: thiol reductant ABC exporter subunit CydC [Chloroflexi bacterium]|nr:thiol reductant ABC exporter subunit CydC [Chloroflexota bacterium]
MNGRTSYSDESALVRLVRLAWPYRWWMALSMLLGFATIGSAIGLMSTAAWIIARAALHPSIAVLQVAIVGVRFFGIARGVFRYLERVVSHQTTFRLLSRLRVWFYERVEPLAPARLEQYHSGDLLSRIGADIDTLENFYLRVLAPPAIAALVTLMMALFFGAIDLRLALAIVAYLALAGIGVPLLTRHMSRRAGQSLVATRGELNATLVDGVQGLPDLVAYGQEARQIETVRGLSARIRDEQAHMARIGGLDAALGALLTGLAVITVLALAIPLVSGGHLDGVLLAVLALATISSFEAVLPLPQAFQHLESNLAAAQRLFDLVDATPAVVDPPDPLPPPARADLAAQDLRFCYAPDDPPALDGVSFTLPQGGTLAIVGASGAGKSTLVNLLLRFWDYGEGTITLGGQDLRCYRQDDVRAQFAVVRQDTHLFSGTIRDNLRLAQPEAPEQDLIAAARRAQLDAFIQGLPQGYDTWIGEQGLALSGGERQRLAIARAVLKDAPILVLDEATANLDAVTERAVMDAIAQAMRGRTTLMITHRLVGLEAVDEILVLDAGRVVERGRHDDLLAREGVYRRLWDLQRQELVETAT